MTSLAGTPVVVGVDGSDDSRAAVLLAAHEASSRNRPLRVVHALIWPLLHVPLGPSPEGPPEGGLRHQAENIVADAAAFAAQSHPHLTITSELVIGAAAPVLLEEARHATMVVLGHRGLGGFTGLLIGSVGVQVAAHANCPVLVVRGQIDPRRDVLVGVDGSPTGVAALGFAFEEASLRRVGLTAVHAFTQPLVGGPGELVPLVHDEHQLETKEAELLAEALAGWRDRFPDVALHPLLVRDRPARALVSATERAGLVVVGSRGRGGFTGLLLGSVSQALLHHASCPVAVIHSSHPSPSA